MRTRSQAAAEAGTPTTPTRGTTNAQPATNSRARPVEVFLLVYPPPWPRMTPEELHWSLCWEVSDGVCQYVTCDVPRHRDLPTHTQDSRIPTVPQLFCTFCSAETNDLDGTMVPPRWCSLGKISAQRRTRIKEIALEVPAPTPKAGPTCKDWMLAVLRKMVDDGIISEQVLKDTVTRALNGASRSL